MVCFPTFTIVKIQNIFDRRYLHVHIVNILSRKNIVYKLVYVMLMRIIYSACLLHKCLRQHSATFGLHSIKT